MSYNKFCAEDVLQKLGEFPLEKKKVFIQDLRKELPQYSLETLEATCVALSKRGIIKAPTYTLKKEGERIKHIKLEP